ncbi:hypothetical protein [Hydrogenophaga sp.]|uniref:hypothetical protein n=1 Tax=Hydrogenophaga sp. TaxID=1904254 RepID=UPI00345BCE29
MRRRSCRCPRSASSRPATCCSCWSRPCSASPRTSRARWPRPGTARSPACSACPMAKRSARRSIRRRPISRPKRR